MTLKCVVGGERHNPQSDANVAHVMVNVMCLLFLAMDRKKKNRDKLTESKCMRE